MLKNTNQSIANCLENVAEICMLLHDGLYDGTIPDLATEADAKHLMRGAIADRAAPEDDANILLACLAFVEALAAYEAVCAAIRRGDDDRDPGPSQEQRL